MRALAVVSVFLFHLNEHFLTGGYLGVDVFFVISGYLITGIINRQIEAKEFSLVKFWKRRFKRLYPALLTMVCTVLIASTFILTSPEREALPVQAMAALLSFENIYLWRTTGGYWANESFNISLLHAWSLSVEEQFYLVYPLLLLAISRLSMKNRGIFTCFLMLASLVGFILTVQQSRSIAFYFLHTRMWELLLGGCCYYLQPKCQSGKIKSVAGVSQSIGLLIMVTSFVIFDSIDFISTYPVLLPCLATCMIILFGHTEGPAKWLLSLPPCVYIGKLSYSIYLWHWPVIVLLRYYSLTFSPTAATILTLLFAVPSYHFIEKPLRYRSVKPQILLVIGAGIAIASFLFFHYVHAFVRHDAGTSVNSAYVMTNLADFDEAISRTRGQRFEATRSIENGKTGLLVHGKNQETLHPDLCVIGSSHARVMCAPIANYARSNHYSLLSMAVSGQEISGRVSTERLSFTHDTRLNKFRLIKPRVTFVAGMWNDVYEKADFIEGITKSLDLFCMQSGQVLIMGQVPHIDLPPKTSLRRYLVALIRKRGRAIIHAKDNVAQANQRLHTLISLKQSEGQWQNLTYINPTDLFQDEQNRLSIIQNGHFLYADEHHLNHQGAELVFFRYLSTHMNRFLAEPRSSDTVEH